MTVAYERDPADLTPAHLALSPGRRAPVEGWRPVLRDVVSGQAVVWARFDRDTPAGSVWLRDRDGDRQVTPLPE